MQIAPEVKLDIEISRDEHAAVVFALGASFEERKIDKSMLLTLIEKFDSYSDKVSLNKNELEALGKAVDSANCFFELKAITKDLKTPKLAATTETLLEKLVDLGE